MPEIWVFVSIGSSYTKAPSRYDRRPFEEEQYLLNSFVCACTSYLCKRENSIDSSLQWNLKCVTHNWLYLIFLYLCKKRPLRTKYHVKLLGFNNSIVVPPEGNEDWMKQAQLLHEHGYCIICMSSQSQGLSTNQSKHGKHSRCIEIVIHPSIVSSCRFAICEPLFYQKKFSHLHRNDSCHWGQFSSAASVGIQ